MTAHRTAHCDSTDFYRLFRINVAIRKAVADPGFSRRVEERQPQSWRCRPIIWQNLCRKLQENERNGTERAARIHGGPPGSANGGSCAPVLELEFRNCF